jgi:DNA-directed RNA polymerase subunit beta
MRLGLDAEDTVTTLRKEDILAVVQELVNLKDGKGEIDDIDNLANRRVRSVGELLENQYRVGLLRMERAVKERMSSVDVSTVMPNDLINAKPAVPRSASSSARRSCRSSWTRPTRCRRSPTSAASRRSGRAASPASAQASRSATCHPTHYGRICPIETPEGPNIGLINSLASFSRVNKYGFIETPVPQGRRRQGDDEVVYLSGHGRGEAHDRPGERRARSEGRLSPRNHLGPPQRRVPDRPARPDHADGRQPKQLVSVAGLAHSVPRE